MSNTTKVTPPTLVYAKTRAHIAKLKLEAIKWSKKLTLEATRIKPIINADNKTKTHTVIVGGSTPGIGFVAFFPHSIKAKGELAILKDKSERHLYSQTIKTSKRHDSVSIF